MIVKSYNKRRKEEFESDITLTYLVAYWQRVKKMPSLKKVLGQDKPKNMTAEEMLKVVKQLNASFGGEVK